MPQELVGCKVEFEDNEAGPTITGRVCTVYRGDVGGRFAVDMLMVEDEKGELYYISVNQISRLVSTTWIDVR